MLLVSAGSLPARCAMGMFVSSTNLFSSEAPTPNPSRIIVNKLEIHVQLFQGFVVKWEGTAQSCWVGWKAMACLMPALLNMASDAREILVLLLSAREQGFPLLCALCIGSR